MNTQDSTYGGAQDARHWLRGLTFWIICSAPLVSFGATWNGYPPQDRTNQTADTVLRWSSYTVVQEPVSYAVYFGRNAVPGPAEYLGTTTNQTWPLPRLTPATTYYWQIVSDNPVLGSSPVWRFTTRGLHHFEWESVGPTQYVGRPFLAAIRAVDEFGQTVSKYTDSLRLTAFTNWVRLLYQEDFEDGDARGWQVCRDEFAATVTNVPGSGGQFCLAVAGQAIECDEEGVAYRFGQHLDILPKQISFRVRSSSTNVNGATLRVSFGDPTVRFGMGPGGLMGLDSSSRWILRYNLAPAVPYAPNRWYDITLVFEPEPVQDGYWDDGAWFPQRYTLLWLDWYVDGRLIDSHIDLGVRRWNGCGPIPPDGLTLQTIESSEAWFDDIEFRAPPEAMPIRMQPTGPVWLTNGVWTGQVLIEAPAQELYLQADDGQQHVGTSSPVTVLAGTPFAITSVTRTNDQLYLEWQGGSGLYQVQTTSNVVQGPWTDFGPPTTNTSLTVPTTNPAAFFRLQSLTNAP